MVVWRSTLTLAAVLRRVRGLVPYAALLVVLHVLALTPGPTYVVLTVVVGLAALAWDLVVTARGRVLVDHDGLEVRGLLTRRWSWASLRSLTLEEDGRIELTPNGWVRHLPIPRAESADAYRTLLAWSGLERADRPVVMTPVDTVG